MKKLFCSFALTLMVMFLVITAASLSVYAEDYVLYVGDVQVTSANASDIFGDGTAVYDEASSTLTLNNATINTSTEFTDVLTGIKPVTFRAMLYAEQSLTINVIGECRLSNDTSANGTYENSYGVVMKGSDTNSPDLTIRGIEMSASRFYINPNAATGDMTGILAWHSNIYIDKVQLTASCYKSYGKETPFESFGIRAVSNANVFGNLDEYDSGSIFINSAEVSAIGSNVTGNSDSPKSEASSTGLTCYALCIYNASDVYASGGDAQTESISAYSNGLSVGRRFEVYGQSTVMASSHKATVKGSDGDEDSAFSLALVTGATNVIIDGASTVDVSAENATVEGDEDSTQMFGFASILGGGITLDGASTLDVNVYNVCEDTTNGILVGEVIVNKGKIVVDMPSNISGCENYAAVLLLNQTENYEVYDRLGNALVFDSESGEFFNEDGSDVTEVVVSVGMYEDMRAYDLYVGGVRVNDGNKDDVLGNGTVSYDPETNILTLDNAHIEGCYYSKDVFESYASAIFYGQSVTIVVKGECEIETVSHGAEIVTGIGNNGNYENLVLTIMGDGDDVQDVLTVTSDDAINSSSAIYNEGGDIVIKNVTVYGYGGTSGQGGDVIRATSINTSEGGTLVYKYGGDITIEDATIYAYGPDDVGTYSYAIAGRTINIKGTSEANLYGGDISVDGGSSSAGIMAFMSVTVSDDAVVNTYGGKIVVKETAEDEIVSAGIYSLLGSVSVNGNAKVYSWSDEVSFENGTVCGTSVGVWSPLGLFMEDDAYLYGKSDKAAISVGVVAMTAVLDGGKVEGEAVQTTGTTKSGGIYFATEIENATIRDASTNELLRYVDETVGYVNFKGQSPLSSVATPGNADDYRIWVGGVQVTEENMHDVLGDGTVSYDIATNTLTLNNADISGGREIAGLGTAAIYAETPLVIKVVGTNTVTSGSEGSYADAGIYYGGQDIEGAAAITIFGESTDDVLNVHTSDAVYATAAIASTSGNIIFKDVTVNAECGDSGCDSYGIAAGVNKLGNIIVDGAIVNVESGDILASDVAEEGTSVGVVADDIDIINNGQLNVLGGDVNTLKGGTSIGINTFGNLNVLDGSSVNAEGGTVTETSGEVTGNSTSAGVVSNGSLTVDGGSSVSGTGGETSGTSAGIYSAQTNVPDGTVTGSSVADGSTLAAGIVSGNDISDSKIYDVDSGEELTYNSAYSTYVDSNGVPSKNTTVVGGIIIGDYNLVVGHVSVSVSNKDDIFGDLDGEGATAYYDPATNTLYLENANITTYFGDSDIVVGVGRYGSLNIKLIGENKITLSANEYNYDTVIGLAATGELNISSDENATLDVVVNTQASLIGAGIATIDISGEGKPLDITVSGKATVTARAGKVVYHSNAPSVGILSGGSLSVLDNASIYGYGGELVLADDGTHSGDVTVSAGVIASANLIVDTTGKVYGKGGNSDVMSAGVGAYGYTDVINGVIIGDVTGEMTYGGLAGGVAFINMPTNVVAYTGASADELNVNTYWAFDESIGLGTYVDDSYNIGLYTMILPGSGMNVLESSSTGTAGPGSVTVYVTGYDNVLVAFASYDENGRMIDMSYSHSSSADEFGKFTCDTLDMTGAVRVKSFMFENSSYNIVPLCEALESFVPVS